MHNFVVEPGSISYSIFCQNSKNHFPFEKSNRERIRYRKSWGTIKKSPLTYTSQKRISLIVVANLLILGEKKGHVKSCDSIQQFWSIKDVMRQWRNFFVKERIWKSRIRVRNERHVSLDKIQGLGFEVKNYFSLSKIHHSISFWMHHWKVLVPFFWLMINKNVKSH